MSNNLSNKPHGRVVIRIGRHHLSFTTVADTEPQVNYEPYVMKSGVSVAANLREVLKAAGYGRMGMNKALAMVDVPVLLTPVELFEETTMGDMYSHSFPRQEQEQVFYNVLPDLNAVAVFALNKDLKTVLDDNFSDLRLMVALTPVWRYLHKRSFTGARNKLYGYFHDQKLDIISFRQNRFKFYNQFETNRAHDALYFLLYVWKQLLLDAEHDELHLIGSVAADEQQWLIEQLHTYLQNVYEINAQADFGDMPVAGTQELPFDLRVLLAKGRV
jgi:hypothetical protein